MPDPTPLMEALRGLAQQHPTRPALVTPPPHGMTRGLHWSYAELMQGVEVQAARLADRGVTRSSVVGIACADEVRHLLLCLACLRLGATSCSLPTHDTPAQRERLQTHVGVTHVFAEGDALDPSTPVEGECTAQEFEGHLLFATSGTTGEPKIVRHSSANLVAQAPRHVSPDERFACLASVEHNFSKRHRLYCLAQGATSVFLRSAPEFLVKQCLALEVTTLHLSAFQAQEVLALPGVQQLRGLRLKLGGSHVTADLRARLRAEITDQLCCGYGTTETGAIGFTDPGDHGAGESVGRPLPGIVVRVQDEGGRAVPQGERGEIAIRCSGMFEAYLGLPELTASRLVQGWFHTGDTGYLDAEGRLHLSGRADDMFVFNSINIYPQDLEAQVRQHPDVVDVAVLPKPSPVHGDVPVALVVFDPDRTPDLRGLRSFVREKTGVRCPRQFRAVESIPRNGAGKILRSEARELLDGVVTR